MPFASPETRIIVLPDAKNRTIVSLFVWTEHRIVTEGRTDKTAVQKWFGYYSGLHSEQCGRAEKKTLTIKKCKNFRGCLKTSP